MQARRGVTELAHWYNEDHRHSAIRFVTPAQRHAQRAYFSDRGRLFQSDRGRRNGVAGVALG